jgi:hypothetical protein
MANKFKVEIQETVEELEHRLERAITSVSKEKLLLLYWIATKKIKTREELATPAEARLFNNISLVKSLQTRWNYLITHS